MQRREFNQLLNTLLKPETINDFCPNGLQVEGKDEIRTIVTGVTASQALIDAAIEKMPMLFWYTMAIFGKVSRNQLLA